MINDNVHVDKPDTQGNVKENTHKIVFSLSPAAFERAMNNVFIMFDGHL